MVLSRRSWIDESNVSAPPINTVLDRYDETRQWVRQFVVWPLERAMLQRRFVEELHVRQKDFVEFVRKDQSGTTNATNDLS